MFRLAGRWVPILACRLILLAVLISGCVTAQQAGLPYVDLSQRQPVPAVGGEQLTPLRVAVAAVISPKGTAESYQPLLDYLAVKLQRPVQLIQRRTYAEVNQLIADDQVDIAFVCTSAYVIGQRDFGLQLLAAPQVKGQTVYYSWLIVPADSRATSIEDLRGKKFAFTDPWSTSGRVVPTALVKALGENPETFFGRILYTYSHDDAIRAVASRVADGAAVDSLVYQFAIARESWLGEQTRVIYRSAPFAAPPVVASPHMRPQLRAELQAILLAMADDPAAQPALRALGIDRFVTIEDDAYDSVRQVQAQAGVWELE